MNTRADKPGPEMPAVEVIVVAFNRGDSLASCLTALPAAGKGLAMSVSVIDNCSSENIGAMVRNSGICADSYDRKPTSATGVVTILAYVAPFKRGHLQAPSLC